MSKKYNRPKYSLEFKQDAAKLVLEKGYSQQQEADHLAISPSASLTSPPIGLVRIPHYQGRAAPHTMGLVYL
ncbi:transposase [Methylobacter tundripaludum]|uniref:Transposase n=1 Tax=Methylobacter tundripaludum (strain ATCC BAA-1195 / DSM 17260 / SV96) TaxID=697282 RepID=G3IU32_METTV|nr:transposase [Methylobacter tundripaludum]EGW21515.1 hypothetical protein Mettu_0280 [Methylobacter tundripaludum SV96]